MSINWSEEQRRAIDAIEHGRNILVTGFAGTGKSTLLQHLRESVDRLAVVASTGVAAINVGGETVHRWAALGLGTDPAGKCAGRMRPEQRRAVRQAKVLAIDEVSMLTGGLLNLLDEVLIRVRAKNEPFGGLQVILFGDFLQLPPVNVEDEGGWAFDSLAWDRADIETMMLTKVFRQSDQDFIDVLSSVREGEVTDSVRDCLNECGDASRLTGEPVLVYTHNASVDIANNKKLAAIRKPSSTYEARYTGGSKDRQMLSKQVLAPDRLELKNGARVMLLTNLDVLSGLANGSTGTVVQCHDDSVEVAFDCGVTRNVEDNAWKRENDDGKLIASKTQIPLRLAYAATAHKCQGMQFDNMRVDLTKCFAPGQAYVALSRAKSPAGLHVKDWSEDSIFADQTALQFYRSHSK